MVFHNFDHALFWLKRRNTSAYRHFCYYDIELISVYCIFDYFLRWLIVHTFLILREFTVFLRLIVARNSWVLGYSSIFWSPFLYKVNILSLFWLSVRSFAFKIIGMPLSFRESRWRCLQINILIVTIRISKFELTNRSLLIIDTQIRIISMELWNWSSINCFSEYFKLIILFRCFGYATTAK